MTSNIMKLVLQFNYFYRYKILIYDMKLYYVYMPLAFSYEKHNRLL